MWRRFSDELRRLGRTSAYSWQGFRAAWKSEKSVRQWVAANLISGLLALALDLSSTERALILALGPMVLAAEVMNTAMEATVDLVTPEHNPLAGKAKDCGSAAVALSALAAGAAWIVILFT